MSKYAFKNEDREIFELKKDGFVAEKEYIIGTELHNIYCNEINIINKIIENKEKYFDFSKSMIDIGSEYGTYSFLLNFSHSYMFDGNREKIIISSFNMLLHNKQNFSSNNVLLSDCIENVKFDGFNSEYSNVPWHQNFEIIKTSTIDTFSFKNVGFIKVDVEGMEEKVLRGGINTIISNNYPPILFELWDVNEITMPKEKHESMVKFLNEIGYDILWRWGDEQTHLAIHKNNVI